MQIRFSAGSEVLRMADILKSHEEMARVSVEGALLVYDFGKISTPTGLATALQGIDTFLGEQITTTDDENSIRALTALKQATIDAGVDAAREFNLRDAREQSDATTTDTGSHPTDTGDASTSNAPTQSSVEQNEETENEQASGPQGEQQRRKR